MGALLGENRGTDLALRRGGGRRHYVASQRVFQGKSTAAPVSNGEDSVSKLDSVRCSSGRAQWAMMGRVWWQTTKCTRSRAKTELMEATHVISTVMTQNQRKHGAQRRK